MLHSVFVSRKLVTYESVITSSFSFFVHVVPLCFLSLLSCIESLSFQVYSASVNCIILFSLVFYMNHHLTIVEGFEHLKEPIAMLSRFNAPDRVSQDNQVIGDRSD